MSKVVVNMAATAALATGAAGTKYTVPAGRLGILKHIRVQNPSGSSVAFTMSLGADAAGTRIYDAFLLTAAGTPGAIEDRFVYFVLAAGEVIQAFAGTNNILTLTLDGEEVILG